MSRRRSPPLGLLFSLLLGTVACGVLEPPVARTVDGVTSDGRFIEPDAYALYAVGALREARGQWREALSMYERAFEVDDRGPEIRTRIGAVACKLREHPLADKAFAAAQRSAPDYGPLWYEVAQCRKSRAQAPRALEAALTAVRLDPERFEASLLAADLAEQSGERALAWQLRDALATHAPDSPLVQRSLLAAANKAGDAARAERARTALERLALRAGATRRAGVDDALAALKAGDVRRAKQSAEQLLGAEPGNGDAWVVALAVADLEQDHAAFNRLLEEASQPGTPASPAVLDTLAAVLSRRVSAQAARALQPSEAQ